MADATPNEPKRDRSQFVATLLIILAVAASSFISTWILSTRLAKVELLLVQLSSSLGR